MWERLLFGPGGSEPAELVKAEEARLDAAHALAMTGLRFAVFARAHRLEACRWEIPTPEEVEARHGARLAAPNRAYVLPPVLPEVAERDRKSTRLNSRHSCEPRMP